MTTHEPQAQLVAETLPVPPEFPVTWEQPGDAQLFWAFDPTLPDAMPPMDYLFVRDCLQGFNAAATAYELPMRLEARHINTYLYQAVIPILEHEAPLPAQARAIDHVSEGPLASAVADLDVLWNTSWLPEIKGHLDYWRSAELHTLLLPALDAHLDDTLARSRRVYEIHFLLVFPVFLAISLFEELYDDLFAPEHPFEAYRLLQGFDNKTLEADRALWQLSRRALATPRIREVLAARTATNLPAALEQAAVGDDLGAGFLAELHAYLETYGRRANQWLLSAPTWLEDPSLVITNLQHYIGLPDRDPQAELTALAAERDHLVALARAQLEGYPGPVREQFEALLAAAQTATVLSEEHAFWIDYACLYEVRRVFLEYGRRLAANGRIDQPDDIFFLAREEVREHAAGAPGLDRRELVAARKSELAHFRTMLPPAALGTPPTELPADTPIDRALGKFFGTPPEVSADPDVIHGHAGAPGSVSGPARVIHTLADAGRLQPGDVLVAPATLPAWTPLFATAAAVVTDAGGILSHCAVVAREYRIPAVVGTGTATTTIRDGQMVEVDGSNGVVRLSPGQ